MSTAEITLRLVAGVVLVLLSAFFVVTEFALTRVPRFDEEEFQSSKGLRRAWEMTGQFEIYLTDRSLDRFVSILYVPALFRELEALRCGVLDWRSRVRARSPWRLAAWRLVAPSASSSTGSSARSRKRPSSKRAVPSASPRSPTPLRPSPASCTTLWTNQA